jgi:DNA helicase-2/ATP-dependent DNA helicase PcrA
MWRQNITEAELEEERRLFYVGMTRAQAQLYLSSVVYRFGDRDRAVSMFVREVPSNYVVRWSSQHRT